MKDIINVTGAVLFIVAMVGIASPFFFLAIIWTFLYVTVRMGWEVGCDIVTENTPEWLDKYMGDNPTTRKE